MKQNYTLKTPYIMENMPIVMNLPTGVYAKIVSLLNTMYLQGYEDGINCPEPLDVSEDIKIQLNLAGIYEDYDSTEDAALYLAQRALENPEDYGLVSDGRLESEDFSYNSDEYIDIDQIQYVLVSTSYTANETYVFAANSDGEITNYGELGGIAERWGQEDWEDMNAALEIVFGDNAKYFQVVKDSWGNGPQKLYKRGTSVA
jgi:hypothetical protein